MKTLRRSALVVCLVAWMAMPHVANAGPGISCNYCHDFANWCAGFCHEHGGVQLCTIHTGGSCSDFCLCWDQTLYSDQSGMCSPCNEN